MSIIDLHCDVLYKMQRNAQAGNPLTFKDSPTLDVNLENLKKGNVKVQAFAIFVDTTLPIEVQYANVLDQIEIFHRDVLSLHPEIVHIKKWSQLESLKDDEIGVFLTLEGVDCIGNDIEKLKHILDEGILSVGLTWNYGNFAADGIGELRGGGLSNFGFDVVALLNERGVLTDVSHLSIEGFNDVMIVAKYPIASHSNVYQIADHRRNLTNLQIMKMIERKMPLHLVFAPGFVNTNKSSLDVELEDLLPHIDYLLSLGAEDIIGLGSDFDGIGAKVKNLTNASEHPNLTALLEKHYGEKQAAKISHQNFLDYVSQIR